MSARLGDLTAGQRQLLAALGRSELAEDFYLSGGAALSSQYLHHRQSLDLDFFSRERFDAKRVVRFLDEVADGPMVPRRVHDRLELTVPVAGERLRVEFVHYDFPLIETRHRAPGEVRVDSLRDIMANKLSCLIERAEPKDFVDVLFLLRRSGLDLRRGMEDCERKFRWPGLQFLLQSAFLRIERVTPDAWPRTSPPISLDEASRFFRGLARSLVVLDEDDAGA